MQGRWYTTSGGGGSDVLGMLMFGIVMIAGAGIAAGIAEAVAALVWDLLIVGMVLATVIVAALVTLIAVRIRRDLAAVPHGQHFLMQVNPDTGPKAKAVQAARQPMITNNYFGGSHVHHGTSLDTAAIATPLINGAITDAERACTSPRNRATT